MELELRSLYRSQAQAVMALGGGTPGERYMFDEGGRATEQVLLAL
jgi:hypothetical protein